MAFTHLTAGAAPHQHDSMAEAYQCEDERAESREEQAAEAAAERFFEEGTEAQRMQYRWEVEEDERNAAFWSGAFV